MKAEDFTLLDNGHVRKLASFEAVKGAGSATVARVHVLLVLDMLNNSAQSLRTERTAMESYLRRNGGHLSCPVAIVVLSEAGMQTGELSRDGNALADALKALAVPHDHHSDSESNNDTYDFAGKQFPADNHAGGELPKMNHRFQTSVGALAKLIADEEEGSGRAIVVWLGPGWPMLADGKFQQDSAEKQRNFFAHVVEISTGLREAQMTVYNVSTPQLFRGADSGRERYKEVLAGVPTGKQVNSANLALPVLAYQGGGSVIDEGKDIEEGIAAAVAEADEYYVLSFDSAPGAAIDEYRTLSVRVDRPGVLVHTNTGYYAQP